MEAIAVLEPAKQKSREAESKHSMHAIDARQQSQHVPAFGGMILMLDRFEIAAEKRNIVKTNI